MADVIWTAYYILFIVGFPLLLIALVARNEYNIRQIEKRTPLTGIAFDDKVEGSERSDVSIDISDFTVEAHKVPAALILDQEHMKLIFRALELLQQQIKDDPNQSATREDLKYLKGAVKSASQEDPYRLVQKYELPGYLPDAAYKAMLEFARCQAAIEFSRGVLDYLLVETRPDLNKRALKAFAEMRKWFPQAK